MSDELDDFLRQAAQRRQQRQQEKTKKSGGSSKPSNSAASSRPVAPTQKSQPTLDRPGPVQRPTLRNERPSVPVAEVVPNRTSISDFQSTIANRQLQSQMSLGDERKLESGYEAFRPSQSQRSDSQKSGNKSSAKLKPEKASTIAPKGAAQSQAMVSSEDIMQQLRDPQTLRMAIIAQEIFRRPYQ
jgi:hypothetical protein